MANLEVKETIKYVPVTIQKEVVEKEYNLSLNKAELVALYSVLKQVRGNENLSHRKYIQSINDSIYCRIKNMPNTPNYYNNNDLSCKNDLINFDKLIEEIIVN